MKNIRIILTKYRTPPTFVVHFKVVLPEIAFDSEVFFVHILGSGFCFSNKNRRWTYFIHVDNNYRHHVNPQWVFERKSRALRAFIPQGRVDRWCGKHDITLAHWYTCDGQGKSRFVSVKARSNRVQLSLYRYPSAFSGTVSTRNPLHPLAEERQALQTNHNQSEIAIVFNYQWPQWPTRSFDPFPSFSDHTKRLTAAQNKQGTIFISLSKQWWVTLQKNTKK